MKWYQQPDLSDLTDNCQLLIFDDVSQSSRTIKLSTLKTFLGTGATPVVPALPTYISLPLTETSGTVAADISGNARNATYVSCVLNNAGVILDTTSRISLNNAHGALGELSIGLEFKTNASIDHGLWEFRASQDLSSGVYTPALMMNGSGQLAVYGYPSGSSYSSQTFKDNAFHKSIVTMSNSSIKIFVDKVKVVDVNANPLTNFTGFFSIGSTRAKGNFSGQLKNFRVWNSILTESQAVDLS